MRRYRLALLLPLLLAAAVQAQDDASSPAADDVPVLAEREMLDGAIALLVPAGFEPMGEEMLGLKYPTANRPTEVLTNAAGSVNLAFNYTSNAVQPEQIEELLPTLKQMMDAAYPEARWNRSEVERREGRPFAVLDLWTPALDTGIRNIMVATSVGGRFLLVSFNATDEMAETWVPLGERMMASVRVLD